MIIKLLQIELLKTKRSLAFLMMFLCPLMVVLVNILLLIKTDGKMVEENGWFAFWLTNFGMWGYFMMPLYIALITALLNGIDHKSHGWRYMATMPIKASSLFLCKFVLAGIYLIGATVVLFIALFGTVFICSVLGVEGGEIFNVSIIKKMGSGFIASLAILSIQHIVSWRWLNMVAPLGLGVLATFSILQFSGSKYWVFNPWSYTLMATNGADNSNQIAALYYSIIIMALVILLGMYWSNKKEVFS